VDQQLDQVDTGSTAKAQISDWGERVTEGRSPRYVSELWKVRGLGKGLEIGLRGISSTVLLKCHKGALIADTFVSWR
jgi:hypothetical protein